MPAFGTVFFDCDSTLTAVEGIDELARENGARIANLTAAAMRGELPLEEVYGARLELVRPDRAGIEALARRYVEALVPDAAEVVAALRRGGVEVRIISGGLEPAVRSLARALGLPPRSVDAVAVQHDARGEFAGFDRASPLTRAGGKAEVIRHRLPELDAPVMLVGDGVTDLEAKPAVDLFVAYAGVVDRPEVTAAAELVIRSASLAPLAWLALGGEAADERDIALVERGGILLEEEAVDRRSAASEH